MNDLAENHRRLRAYGVAASPSPGESRRQLEHIRDAERDGATVIACRSCNGYGLHSDDAHSPCASCDGRGWHSTYPT